MMERLLRPSEARKILVCSTAEMYRILRDGEIASIRRGNRWYISQEELNNYIRRVTTKGVNHEHSS